MPNTIAADTLVDFDPNERTTTDELLAAAQELVQRLTYLSTASALPGDESMRWHDQHEEAVTVAAWIASGLVLIEVPE